MSRVRTGSFVIELYWHSHKTEDLPLTSYSTCKHQEWI